MKTYNIYWDHLNGNIGNAKVETTPEFLEDIEKMMATKDPRGTFKLKTITGRTMIFRVDQLTAFGYEEEL